MPSETETPAGATPGLKAIIAFYEQHGYFPIPMKGGEEVDAAAAAKASDDAAAKEAADKEAAEATALGLGDAGKKALDAERLRAKNAEKLASDHAKELETLRKEKADAATAKAKLDEEEATKKGEFEQLAEKRKGEADAARADADAKTKDLERANSVIAGVLTERIAALEAMKDAELSAEFAAITEPLDQIDWFNKASTKRAMANQAEADKVAAAKGKPGVPLTPKPNGDGKPTDDQARAGQARSYANW